MLSYGRFVVAHLRLSSSAGIPTLRTMIGSSVHILTSRTFTLLLLAADMRIRFVHSISCGRADLKMLNSPLGFSSCRTSADWSRMRLKESSPQNWSRGSLSIDYTTAMPRSLRSDSTRRRNW